MERWFGKWAGEGRRPGEDMGEEGGEVVAGNDMATLNKFTIIASTAFAAAVVAPAIAIYKRLFILLIMRM